MKVYCVISADKKNILLFSNIFVNVLTNSLRKIFPQLYMSLNKMKT